MDRFLGARFGRLPPLEREASARAEDKDDDDMLRVRKMSSMSSVFSNQSNWSEEEAASRQSTPSSPLSTSARSRRVRLAPRLDPLRSPFHGTGGGLEVEGPALPLSLRRTKTCPVDVMTKAVDGDSPDSDKRSAKSCRHAQAITGDGDSCSRRRRHINKRAETTKACFAFKADEGFGLPPCAPASGVAGRATRSSPSHTDGRRRSSSVASVSSRGRRAATVSKVKPAVQQRTSSINTPTPNSLGTPSTTTSSPAWVAAQSGKDLLGSIKKWRCGSKIGQGSYGCVYKALEVTSGTIFAVKKAVIKENDPEDSKYVEKLGDELEIFRHLRHPNVVSFLGHEIKDGELCIFMEYVPGGSLSAMLGEFGPFSGKLLRSATLGMLQGLDYLHTHNPPVIHRDIKSANVLVDKDFGIKLSDFGCSKRCDVSTSFTTVGSIPWMAPEVIQQTNGYGRKADIWSLGCTVIELATAEMPWGKGAFDNLMFAIKRIGMSDETPAVPDELAPPLKDLVHSCLRRDADLRPSASDLVDHDFFLGKVCGKTAAVRRARQ